MPKQKQGEQLAQGDKTLFTHPGASSGVVCCVEAIESQGGPSQGDQRELTETMGLCLSGLCPCLLEAHASLGDPQGLKPIQEVADLIKRHLANLLTYFKY